MEEFGKFLSVENGAALQGFWIELEKSLPVACLPGVA
jgi:hypothetical protein